MSEPAVILNDNNRACVTAYPNGYDGGPGLVFLTVTYDLSGEECTVDFTEEQCLALEKALREARESL